MNKSDWFCVGWGFGIFYCIAMQHVTTSKATQIWLTRLLFTTIVVTLFMAGTWIFSRGFMMSNSSAADLCFGVGLIFCSVGMYAILSVIVSKQGEQAE